MKNQEEESVPETPVESGVTVGVAIVEDDAELRKTLETFINRTPGMKCLAAYGAAEAALKGLPGVSPDVVLMDIRLPGMSGIECVERLRTLVPGARVLMLTAFEDADDVFQSLAAGAFGYLLKSAEPARLREAIREVHQGGSPIAGSVARKMVDFFRGNMPARVPLDRDQSALSPREVEVLRHLAEGLSYKQVALDFGVSINTIRTHIKRIYEKLHACNRTEAVRKFRDRGSR